MRVLQQGIELLGRAQGNELQPDVPHEPFEHGTGDHRDEVTTLPQGRSDGDEGVNVPGASEWDQENVQGSGSRFSLRHQVKLAHPSRVN